MATVLFTIVPWIGVMMAGYGFGMVLESGAARRDRWCVRIGLFATALFIGVGGALVNKYRDSQLFPLMTLGPAIALLPPAERARGWIVDVFAVFGRVPLFYYLLHIPLIHALSLRVWYLRDGNAGRERFASAPFVFIEQGA